MASILAVTLEKLRQLSMRVGSPQVPSKFCHTTSPAQFVGRVGELAAAVEAHGSRRCEQVEAGIDVALIEDLFAFLHRLPSRLKEDLDTLALRPSYSMEEPRYAWEEPRSDTLVALAALVQDVWEHTFGPEREDAPPLLEYLRRLPMCHALDFGSGAGYFAFALARFGVNVTCVEPGKAKRAFLQFRRSRRPEGKNILFRSPKRQYPAILAINVLDHMLKPEHGVRKLAALTKPGGLLICRAAFQEDGWHTGGVRVRERVYRELMRYYATLRRRLSLEIRRWSLNGASVLLQSSFPAHRRAFACIQRR